MKLRSLSRGFLAAVVATLVVNALVFGLLVFPAEREMRRATDERQRAIRLVDQIREENDLLAELAQGYTARGADSAYVSYLTLYYELLAVRAGERPLPPGADVATFWRMRLLQMRSREWGAGARREPSPPVEPLPETPGLGIAERMRRERFPPAELALAERVRELGAETQRLEKLAFAEAQGMSYDPVSGEFVDGLPDPDAAYRTVRSPRYEQSRLDLARAVHVLRDAVRARTDAALELARGRLRFGIELAGAVNVAMVAILALVVLILRRSVLDPVRALGGVAARVAGGDYGARTPPLRAGVAEIVALGRSLDAMANRFESDLAERERASRELQLARDEAREATEAKSRFVRNMSHEMRTPMNTIVLGMTHLALQTDLTPEQRGYLDKAQAASRMMLALINDVLDFSKIEAGRMTIESARFSVEDVVSQAVELVRQPALEKEIELLCDFADPALLAGHGALRGDALRLQQVLTNLLSNAVKFTPRGQVRLTVDTDPDPDSGHAALRFVVEDTGIGMSEDELGRLFGEFVQADVSTTRRYGGTGLGLAITRRLVELMGGTIGVASRPGAGSRFEVRLVLPRESAAPVGVSAEAATARVLVVDDQPDTRVAILGQLHTLGIGSAGRLAGAGSGAQAIAAAEEALRAGRPFDRVLLDWMLPDLDGAIVLERLLALHPAARVAIVTAYGTEEVMARARGLGASDFIAKPVLPEDLRRLFRSAPQAAPVAPGVSPLRGLRVLLVEDHPLNQELAAALLRRRGAEVAIADNGLIAVETLAARGPQAFDVVLMDLQMPVLDGLEATRRLRQDRRFDALPVFAMTAHALDEERRRCLVAGMQGHLAKPLDIAALEAALAPLAHAAPGSPAAPVAPPPPAVALPAMRLLDTEAALQQFDGNVGLYRRTLRGFVQQYGDGIADWDGLAAAGRWAELRRAAHTLQGLAGTIGAPPLREGALAVERAAAAEDPAAAAGLAPLADALAAVVAEIDAALDAPPPWLESAPVPPDFAPATPAAAVARLRELLEAADSEALGWWQSQQAALRDAVEPGAWRRLKQAMNGLDFDAALAALPRR